MKVKIKRIENGILPAYKREGDVCLDCYARLAEDNIALPAHSSCLVNLGFALELPEGYEAVVRPRSGLSMQRINVSIGTVDINYRGEVKACVTNDTDMTYVICNKERVCHFELVEKSPENFFV